MIHYTNLQMHQINVILKKQLHISTFRQDLEGKWRNRFSEITEFWLFSCQNSGALNSIFLPATHWAWALLLQPNTWTPPLNPSMEPDTACWDTSEIGPNQTRHQILHISCHTCIFHSRWSEYGTLWHDTKIIVKFLYVREIYGFYIFTIHYITLVLS